MCSVLDTTAREEAFKAGFSWVRALSSLCLPMISKRGSADSLLAALLLGTAGVAFALALGEAVDEQRAVDIALVFALLAAVLGVAFVRRGWLDTDERES